MSNTTSAICLNYLLKIINCIIIIFLVLGLFLPKKLIVYHLTLCLIILYLLDNNKLFFNKYNNIIQDNVNAKTILLFIMAISIFNYIYKNNISEIFNKIIVYLDDCIQVQYNDELTLKYKLNFNTQEVNNNVTHNQTISSPSSILKFYDNSYMHDVKNYLKE